MQNPFKINQLGVGIDFSNSLKINILLIAKFHNPPISPPKSLLHRPPPPNHLKCHDSGAPPPLSTNLVKDQDTLPVNRYLIYRQAFPIFNNFCKISEIGNKYSKCLHHTCKTAGRLPLLDKNLSLSANLKSSPL